MLQTSTKAATAPCPKCGAEMTLVTVVPHGINPQIGRHAFLCSKCNQTKTYMLPTE